MSDSEEPCPPGAPSGGVARSASPVSRWLGGLKRPVWPLPMALRARLLLLLGSLVCIKAALLVQMRGHLVQTHWYVGPHPPNWVCPAAFGLFVALGVWNLVGLGKACQAVGIKAVRAANGAVVGLGLLFIFLTLNAGYRNYLYPIMDRVLGWGSLVPYLSLDLFFHLPYLAVWLAGYALAYYLLARSGKELWTPYLTAAVAGAYALVCLRELQFCRDRLLLADGLGLAFVLGAARGDQRWSAWWLVLPVLWVLSAWGLFRYCSGLPSANPYFVMLACDSLVLFGATVLLARKWGFLQAWQTRLPFFFPAFILLSNTHYPAAESYNNLLCQLLKLPHYFLGELGLASLVALSGVLYVRLRPRGAWWWLDLLCVLLIALALADFRLCQVMGVRLDWGVLSFGDSPKMMWRVARPYVPGLAAGFGLLVGAYLLGLRMLLRRRGSSPASPVGGPQPDHRAYGAACLVSLAVVGWAVTPADNARGQVACQLVRTCPLWQSMASPPLARDEFLRRAKSLGLGDFEGLPPRSSSREPARMNVLLVFMESSYNQHLSLFGSAEETQPLLSKYKDRMELFPNFFSNFAASMNARFATFTSLYPARDCARFTSQRVKVKSLFEVLHDQGYTCSLFYSSYLDYTGFRDFLRGRGLDEMYEAETMPGQRVTKPLAWGIREEETLGAIRSQIRKYATGRQPFFLTYVPAAPHYPYDGIPRSFCKFRPRELGDYTPVYINELLYMDWVIASIVDQLKGSALLDQTLVIITNDHGEMLGANGGSIGHGWALTPELANTPLIVLDPRHPGYHLNYTPGSQIDVLPTVLDRLGIPIPAGELYEGRSLDAEAGGEERVAYLNTFQQYAVLSGNRLIFGQRSPDPGGKEAPGGVYVMTNQASKTVFAKQSPSPEPPPSIRAFDDFQENLLRHYSFYQHCLRRGPSYSRR